MSEKRETINPFDPFGLWQSFGGADGDAWQGYRDQVLGWWSKSMIDFVNSEAYAQATGRWLDAYLTASIPLQQTLEKVMGRVLATYNLPSRSEVTTLAERLTNIEMRIDDLDAKLDALTKERS